MHIWLDTVSYEHMEETKKNSSSVGFVYELFQLEKAIKDAEYIEM